MGSRKPEKAKKPSKPSHRNPKRSLGSKSKPPPFKKTKKKPPAAASNSNPGDSRQKKKQKLPNAKTKPEDGGTAAGAAENDVSDPKPLTAPEQLKFFIDLYQSANSVQLTSLELESINDSCILDLPQDSDGDDKALGKQIKASFGETWREVLCEKNLVEGKVEPGSPAVLVVATSAIRAIEVLREFRSLTKECHAAKLFSKHIKVEEQVTLLKNRVNIAGGTPSRIKKLIELEALGLSRLSVLLIDMHVDVKGYSLLTLPQVSDEFWDLYKTYFHRQLLDGHTRICLYGPLQDTVKFLMKKRAPRI